MNDDEETNEEEESQLREMAHRVEEAGDRVGMYLLGAFASKQYKDPSLLPSDPTRPPETKTVLTFRFNLGPRAFSNRIQDPKGKALEDSFDDLAASFNSEGESERLRRLAGLEESDGSPEAA